MGWLAQQTWIWLLVAALLGAVLTWLLITTKATGRVAREVKADGGLARADAGTPTASMESSADSTVDSPADTTVAEPVDSTVESPSGGSGAATAATAGTVGAVGAGGAVAGQHSSGDVVTETSSDGQAPYGPGSALPLDDGSAPGPAYSIKGNADTMEYHTQESPAFRRTTAEVWFESEAAARDAGFVRWDQPRS